MNVVQRRALHWDRSDLRPPWIRAEVELTAPPAPVAFGTAHGAHILFRHRGRAAGAVMVGRSRHPGGLGAAALARLLRDSAGDTAAALALADDLGAPEDAPVPSLTVAVCTRARPSLLARTLDALVAMRDGGGGAVRLLVIDNAPPDDATARVVAGYQGVARVVEPVAGLDVARNRALATARTTWLAFVDDDAVPDRGWLAALSRATQDAPDAGAITGPVLPLTLDTEARIRFEAAGGFGAGVIWERYGPQTFASAFLPANSGLLGTGTNMVFRVAALRRVGGFDDALDTGPPLPGGGDTDALQRTARAGLAVHYVPDLAVWHEHRADMAGLRRQFGTWGVSIGAVAVKSLATDPGLRRRVARAVANFALAEMQHAVGRGGATARALPSSHALARLAGLIRGLAGEYGRSRRRMACRKKNVEGAA